MGKEKRVWPFMMGFVIIIALTMGGWIYYNQMMQDIVLEEVISMKTYNKHYVLISEKRNIKFWSEIYESAQKAANGDGAYLELMQNDISTNYTTDEFLKMSIAAKVNGIILEHTGKAETERLINEATEQGIPVVTIIEDAAGSNRESFVGANNYLSGQLYGEKILQILNENTKRIMVLTNGEIERDKNVHTQISAVLAQNGYDEGNIIVETQDLEAEGVFGVEDAIRNRVLTGEKIPDILVCMDEISTESAYQTIIDYNLVAKTKVIGYYASDMAVEGLQQGVIPVIIGLKAEQIGEKSIEALTALSQDGRANEYYTIELEILDKDNIEEYVKNNDNKEDE